MKSHGAAKKKTKQGQLIGEVVRTFSLNVIRGCIQHIAMSVRVLINRLGYCRPLLVLNTCMECLCGLLHVHRPLKTVKH